MAFVALCADGDVSYTLSFYPADERLDGKVHDLKVKIDRKDVDLHYRSGYYSAAKTLPEKQRQTVLIELLGSDANSCGRGVATAAKPVADDCSMHFGIHSRALRSD